MSSIAIPSRRGQRERPFSFPDGSDWQIGTVSPAFEAPPGWFRKTLRRLRRAMRYALLGMLLAILVILLLAWVLDAIVHIWLLPFVLGWYALKNKRHAKEQLDNQPMPQIKRPT